MRATNLESFFADQTNVTTSGTPVQLSSHFVPDGISIMVKAKSGNTGTITVGSSSADALNSATTNTRLLANQAISIQVANSNAIWIDATVSGEGVEYFAEIRS